MDLYNARHFKKRLLGTLTINDVVFLVRIDGNGYVAGIIDVSNYSDRTDGFDYGGRHRHFKLYGPWTYKLLTMHDRIIPLPEYPGRKGASGTAQKIISEIPKCDRFIDGMCGSGYIGSLVRGCQIILNDVDKTVIDRVNCAAGVVKENTDYRNIIDKYNFAGSVFYFDPPYLFQTRSYKGNIYKHEWTELDHIVFLGIVRQVRQPVMISHYPCPLYDRELSEWRKITYRTMTRAGVRDECLYMNYSQPPLLQCFSSVGEDFTDRQRIKRKVDRLMKRLQNEPEKERAAILSSIIDKFSYVTS